MSVKLFSKVMFCSLQFSTAQFEKRKEKLKSYSPTYINKCILTNTPGCCHAAD